MYIFQIWAVLSPSHDNPIREPSISALNMTIHVSSSQKPELSRHIFPQLISKSAKFFYFLLWTSNRDFLKIILGVKISYVVGYLLFLLRQQINKSFALKNIELNEGNLLDFLSGRQMVRN